MQLYNIIAERLSVRQMKSLYLCMYVCMYVCIYLSRLGMRALRANGSITCVGVTHRNVACWIIDATRLRVYLYLLHAAPLECNSQSDAATTTTGDRSTRVRNTRLTSPPCQTFMNLARRRQYRAWVSLYTSYDVFTCIALPHHLREAFTAYTYP